MFFRIQNVTERQRRKCHRFDHPIRKQRAKLLREAGERQVEKFNQAQVGKKTSVIIEQNGHGRTEHFAEVELDKRMDAGTFHTIKITSYEDGLLKGQVV